MVTDFLPNIANCEIIVCIGRVILRKEIRMKTYMVTAFSPNGERLLNEAFTAQENDDAKKKGAEILEAHDLLLKTHRCTSSVGELLLFHS